MPVQPDGVPVGGHAVQDDGHRDDGELRGRLDQAGLDAADDAAVPVQDVDDGGAALVPVERGPARVADDAQPGGQQRPRRPPKPNPTDNPEVFDLSYVGARTRSRRSIKRAER